MFTDSSHWLSSSFMRELSVKGESEDTDLVFGSKYPKASQAFLYPVRPTGSILTFVLWILNTVHVYSTASKTSAPAIVHGVPFPVKSQDGDGD